jgi:hypothetical protein
MTLPTLPLPKMLPLCSCFWQHWSHHRKEAEFCCKGGLSLLLREAEFPSRRGNFDCDSVYLLKRAKYLAFWGRLYMLN